MRRFPLFLLLWVSLCFAQDEPTRTPRPTPTPTPVPYVIEQYSIADDGTTLHWWVYAPPGRGPFKTVVVVHGGGFFQGTPGEANTVYPALIATGHIVFSIEYRLAQPGKLDGQTSSGNFPDQTNDVALAIVAARNDKRGDGIVRGIGGSAGASHMLFAASNGTEGYDKPDVVACLSPATEFDDESSLMAGVFRSMVVNYVGTNSIMSLHADSPDAYISPVTAPVDLWGSTDEIMPINQHNDAEALLEENGVDYESNLLDGTLHAFAYWSQVSAQVIDFIDGHVPTMEPTPIENMTP